ncbi:MAG: HEXXH motif-containing putative peptide modification protein [Nannocystaceae bacterium]
MTRGAARSLAPIDDLTIPEPGSTTAARVLSAAIRRLLPDLGAILHPSVPGDARLRAELRELVRAVKVRSPGALASALRRVDVAVWIRCMRPGAGAAIDRRLGLRRLAFALVRGLALAGGLPPGLRLRVPGPLPPRLISVAAREVIAAPPGAEELELGAEGLRFVGAGVPVNMVEWPGDDGRRFTAIAGDIVLATVDDNPLAGVEAHPDKAGNAVDLGDASTDAWRRALAEALALIGDYLPDLRREIDLVVQQFVPVGVDAVSHLSASYQESIGTIYLSLHPRLMTMTEAVIHEFSHNKLNALLEVDPVLVNAFSTLHRSPVRPDPRPLHGILLAVHAFLPVARLYERMLAAGDPRVAGADTRYRDIVRGNHEGAQVILERGEATAIGAGLVAEIERWDRHFAAQRGV